MFIPKQTTLVFSSLLISGNNIFCTNLEQFTYSYSRLNQGYFCFFFSARTNPATRVESWKLDFIEDIHNRHSQEVLQKSRTSSPWPSEGKRYETCVKLTLRAPVHTNRMNLKTKILLGNASKLLRRMFSKCFLSTLKRKTHVFKFLRFEGRFRKAPFS